MAERGALRIYLGACPGVGKTFAMLSEGHRRLERGTDVVLACVATHGRRHTAELVAGLPQVPARIVAYRGAEFEEMDLQAVLDRRPQVALVDELAHANVPGAGPNEKRWQDVQAMLAAGINVISTVNVQHLESLNDVVKEITGVAQSETVPDAVVRAADQIELIDMTPEALRRRMAHGNIYPPQKVDEALDNYFRGANLTALRELALLWVADQVEVGLQRYREEHGIAGAWQTRERLVVAVDGGDDTEALIRRAGRLAGRITGSDLIAVHISRADGLSDHAPAALDAYRELIESLNGEYRCVSAEDVPNAIVGFARSVAATQIILGAPRRKSRFRRGSGIAEAVIQSAGAIDVLIAGRSED